jgi:hypothetical protein
VAADRHTRDIDIHHQPHYPGLHFVRGGVWAHSTHAEPGHKNPHRNRNHFTKDLCFGACGTARSSDKLKLNSFWLLDYVSDEVLTQSTEKFPGRVYEVWLDDIVVATDYIGPVHGKPKSGKKVATPGKSALLTPGLLLAPPGKVVFSENFDKGPGSFRGGEIRNGALACPPKGVDCWRTFSVPVNDSTTVRFKLKLLADIGQVTVLIWSDKLKDNARYHIAGLKRDEWRSVEFRAIEARTGWAADGASLDGAVLNNVKVLFDDPPAALLLLDDFEVTE